MSNDDSTWWITPTTPEAAFEPTEVKLDGMANNTADDVQKKGRGTIVSRILLIFVLVVFAGLFVMGYLELRTLQKEQNETLLALQAALQANETLHEEQAEAFTKALGDTAADISAEVTTVSEKTDALEGSLGDLDGAFRNFTNEPARLYDLLQSTVYFTEGSGVPAAAL